MFSFICGVAVIGVTFLVCYLTGNTPTGGWYVPCAIGGWLCFAPVRRALYAGGPKRPNPPRP